MPRKSLSAAEAAAWAALIYAGKLQLDKQKISRGSYRVDLHVKGTVAGHEVEFVVAGEATQSGQITTASSTGPGADELWAYARQHIPATRIDTVEREAIAMFSAEERLPNVEEGDAKAAKPFLKQCRASQSKLKDGPFTFAADPDPDALQAATDREAA